MDNKNPKQWYTDPDFYFLVVVIAFIIFGIIGAVIYIPQKWEACGKLYDNAFARIMCFNEG